MAIIWNKIIPRWDGLTIEPPEAKKDVGYIAGDKPPAKWENWLRKGTYEALDETRDVIESIDSQMAQLMNNEKVRVVRNANQSIAPGVDTTIAFNQTIFDNANQHNPVLDNSRLTCKKTGIYIITANVRWETNATSYRLLRVRKNGAIDIAIVQRDFVSASVAIDSMVITTIAQLNVNDYVELIARHGAASSLEVKFSPDYSPSFSMVKVG